MHHNLPRLFTQSFVQDQRALLVAASAKQGALNGRLYNEIELNKLLDEMRQLRLAPSEMYGQDVNLNNLASQIKATQTALNRSYQNRPTERALDQIYANMAMLAQYYGLKVVPQSSSIVKSDRTDAQVSDEKLETPLLKSVGVEAPLSANDNSGDHEKLFGEHFIQQQKRLLQTAENISGQLQDNFSNDDMLQPILDALESMIIRNNVITSTINVGYRHFLAKIDWTMQQFEENYRKNNSCVCEDHPVTNALKQVKNNFLAIARLNASQAVAHEEKCSADRTRENRKTRMKQVGDALGMAACSLWYVPEKIVTVNNGFNRMDCCDQYGHCRCDDCSQALCDEPENYYSLFAPARTVKSLKQQFVAHQQTIETNENLEIGDFAAPGKSSMG